MSTIEESRKWELSWGDPGNRITLYAESVEDVLELCGQVLYTQYVGLEVMTLDIMKDGEKPEQIDVNPNVVIEGVKWEMQTTFEDGQSKHRYLKHKYELFGMIIADLRQGAKSIAAMQL